MIRPDHPYTNHSGARRRARCIALLLLVLALPAATRLAAQPYPVTIVNVSVTPPYSPYLSDWERNPDRVLVTLRNTSATQSYDVRLSGFAESLDGAVRVETKDDFPGARRITLAPNAVLTVNARATGLFDVNAVRFKGTSAGDIKRTGQLPEGTYRVCIRALEYDRPAVPLSQPDPPTCSNVFTIRYVDEPRPVAPACSTVIENANKPQLIVFQWVAPGAPAGTEYEFVMVEIPDKRSAEEALRTAPEPPLFRRRGLMTSMLTYTPADPPLRTGVRYAWRVTARDPQNRVMFRRNGVGAACEFTLGAGRRGQDDPFFGGRGGDNGKLPSDSSTIGFKDPGFKDPGYRDPGIGDPWLRDPSLGNRVPDGLLDGKLFAECIVLMPQTAQEAASDPPQFAVTVEPGINMGAVNGGRLEIWRLERRGEDPAAVASQPDRRVFNKEFTGAPSSYLRYAGSGSGGRIDILSVNRPGAAYTFAPETNVEYVWRFTLSYDPRTLLSNGRVCALSRAYSRFGHFPSSTVRRNMPDTLLSNGFEIVVESWDERSQSSDPSLPSGIGRVKLNCEPRPAPSTLWRGVIDIKPRLYDVVPSLKDPAAQIQLEDARHVDPAIAVGERMEMLLPEYPAGTQPLVKEGVLQRMIADRNLLVDYFRRRPAEGIRVAFRDVRWSGPVRPKVTLTEGIAAYPTAPPVPAPPAEVRLDSGLTLAIDSLTITPARTTVRGGILLPDSIIALGRCSRGRLELPETEFTADCEFYTEVPDQAFGPFEIGSTGFQFSGRGYAVDFSSTRKRVTRIGVLRPEWKGILLDSAVTPAAPTEMPISNRGYVFGHYTAIEPKILATGFTGSFALNAHFRYVMLEPYGYELAVKREGTVVTIVDNRIREGGFIADVFLPAGAVRSGSGEGGRVVLPRMALHIDSTLNYDGTAVMAAGTRLTWGEFTRDSIRQAYSLLPSPSSTTGNVHFSTYHRAPFIPVASGLFMDAGSIADLPRSLRRRGMQGLTFGLAGRRFGILTQDMASLSDTLVIPEASVDSSWLNVGAQGVNGAINVIEQREQLSGYRLGPVHRTRQYRGNEPFNISFGKLLTTAKEHQVRPPRRPIRFVQSAVWEMGFRGDAVLAGAISDTVLFTRMMFTSTAECAGGLVYMPRPMNMAYWGTQLVGRVEDSAAGLLSVRDGVIYTTSAGIAEPRHFGRPFYLSWGEIRADGNVGELHLDYNNAGQTFDRFPYAPHRIALSAFSAAPTGTVRDTSDPTLRLSNPLRGYIQTQGTVSIGFFGAKRMSIADYRMETVAQRWVDSGGDLGWRRFFAPDGGGRMSAVVDTMPDGNTQRGGRWIRLWKSEHMGMPPSDLHWERSWAGDMGTFAFDMDYDSATYDGFSGRGRIGVAGIRGLMGAHMKTRAEGSCFNANVDADIGFEMGYMANAGMMANAWACGCMVGESLERIALGGSLSAYAGGFFNMARTGATASVLMSIAPTRTVFDISGDFFANVMDLNVEISGQATLIHDLTNAAIEGSLRGRVDLASFIAGVSGEGEFDWHLSPPVPGISPDPYQFIQGRVGVSMYALAVGAGLEAGVFIGVNAPQERAWVMQDADGRFGVNMAMLPDRLTGVYAYMSQSTDFNVLLVSGGYRVYVGMGAFEGTITGALTGTLPGPPRVGRGSVTASVLGNVGVYVYGKILGGLLGVGGYANLQMLAGLPPAFQGTIGLEACALWVFCGSVDVHCGFNSVQGFFIY